MPLKLRAHNSNFLPARTAIFKKYPQYLKSCLINAIYGSRLKINIDVLHVIEYIKPKAGILSIWRKTPNNQSIRYFNIND